MCRIDLFVVVTIHRYPISCPVQPNYPKYKFRHTFEKLHKHLFYEIGDPTLITLLKPQGFFRLPYTTPKNNYNDKTHEKFGVVPIY